MISQLSILNYALIENVEIRLKPGLTVLTGETGSGKSILLGALGMLQGQRADLSALRDPSKKCIIEAVFLSNNQEINDLLKKHDLDPDDEITLRREIATKGKSRAFINDTPVTLEVLGEIGRTLVDIHSQHESLMIASREFLFPLLDQAANQKDKALKFRQRFQILKQNEKDLLELEEAEAKARMDEDYFRFQLNELHGFDFEKIDLKLLEAELETLGNAEEIKKQLGVSWAIIEGDEGGLNDQLAQAMAALSKVSRYNSSIQEIASRLETLSAELKDVARDIERTEQGVNFDQERIRELESITGKLFELQQKHRLPELSGLILLKAELEEKLGNLGSLESRITELRSAIISERTALKKWSKELHKGRSESSERIAKDVSAMLLEMQMPFAAISIDLKELEVFNDYGSEQATLMFRPNKGSEFRPIQKIASGGELSRIMLALKSALSSYKELPTLILDEIDSGVSGEIAAKMGGLMKKMSGQSQILAITHLPQIAGIASYHFKVYKESAEHVTTTHVKQLKKEERVQEIAGLLSGTSTSEAAVKHARVLLDG